VENLELRCRHVVTYLKHFESLNKADDLGNSASASADAAAGGSASASAGSGAANKAEREAKAELEHRKQQTLERLIVIGAYLRDFSDMVQEYDVHRKEEIKSGKASIGAAKSAKARPTLNQIHNATALSIGSNGLSAYPSKFVTFYHCYLLYFSVSDRFILATLPSPCPSLQPPLNCCRPLALAMARLANSALPLCSWKRAGTTFE
jgi:hypothetical protein